MNNYIKDIKYTFSLRGKGKKEKEYLNNIILKIKEYPELTYDEYVDKFGTTKDIYLDFITNVESDYLLDKLKTRNYFRVLYITAIAVVVLIGVWKVILAAYDAKKASEQIITHIEYGPPIEIERHRID